MSGSWYLQPIFDSGWLVLLLVLGLLATLAIRPTSLAGTRWRWLATLRGAAILLLALIMLRPTHVHVTRQPQSAVVVILFDQSASMQEAGTSDGMSRWAEQRRALEACRGVLAELGEKLELRVYGYGEQLQAVELDQGQIGWTSPDSPLTDIGSSVYDAVQRELGKRLAAVFICGDGTQTAYAPRTEIYEAGRYVDGEGAPLFAVAFGHATAAAVAKDIVVEKLPQQLSTYVKTELRVRTSVRARGYANQTIPVALEIRRGDQEWERVDLAPTAVRENDQLLNVELRYVPPRPGQFSLRVRVEPQAGETLIENNELPSILDVREGGLKVLYLYGSRLGEQLELVRTIGGSPDMQLDHQLLGLQGRRRWPLDLTRQLGDAAYDVLIIENVDASALTTASWQAAATAVDRGKGLIMIGGYQSFGPGGYFETPLRDVLPIELDRFERQEPTSTAPPRPELHLNQPLAMHPVGDHPLTRLSAGGADLWSQLPPLTGANRFRELKPRASVLLEGPQRQPLLVAGEYGAGRVLAFAGDSTWRWRRHGHEDAHKRFWRQIVYWLARREARDQDDVWIELNKRRFDPGEQLRFTVGANAASGDVIDDANFDVQLLGGASPRPIRLVRDGATMAGLIDGLRTPGTYTLRVQASRNGQPLGETRADLFVNDRQPEKANPAADPDQLARLADMTRNWGGRLLTPDELPAQLEQLKALPAELEVEVERKWQLGGSPTSAWPLLLLLTSLLGSEWFLRKKWGLV